MRWGQTTSSPRLGNMVAHLIACNETYCLSTSSAEYGAHSAAELFSNYCSNDSFAYSTFAPVRLSYPTLCLETCLADSGSHDLSDLAGNFLDVRNLPEGVPLKRVV